MREQRIQKGFHSGGSFLCRSSLEQVIGAQHYQEDIHRCVFGQQSERIRIAWNLPTVSTGIDTFVTGLLRQQVDPTILGAITVTDESSWIKAVSIGIPETQEPHRNHHLV